MPSHIDLCILTPSHPIFDTSFRQSLTEWPLFDNIKFSQNFQNICQKYVQLSILPWKLVKICRILIVWPPIYGLLTEWPFVGGKENLSPKVQSWRLSTPDNSHVKCPRPTTPRNGNRIWRTSQPKYHMLCKFEVGIHFITRLRAYDDSDD